MVKSRSYLRLLASIYFLSYPLMLSLIQAFFSSLHPNTEQILQLHLCNIVTDILIVHQVSVRISGLVVTHPLGYIRLHWIGQSDMYAVGLGGRFGGSSLTKETPFKLS